MARRKSQPAQPALEVVETEAPKVVRPNDLAKELGVDAKRLRAFLRSSKFARPSEQKNTNWELTPPMVEAVKEHFAPKEESAEESA
jgi:phage antirepressor YoqD-like protein